MQRPIGDKGNAWDVRPMLAVAGDLPEGPQWCYEFKWDGVRALVSVRDPAEGGVQITSRSNANITATYPEIVEQARQLLEKLGGTPLRLDGEIVAFGPDGRPSFGALQSRMAVSAASRARRLATETPAAFLPFDVLQLGEQVTLALPYEERRRLLETLPIEVPPSLSGADVSGTEVMRIATAQGLEGVVAKLRSRPYEPGRRTPSWIKVAIRRRQDVVIGGWEPGQHGRTGRLGALLVGVHDEEGAFRYAGQVGSGFTGRTLADLERRLEALRAPAPAFTDLDQVPARDLRAAHWVRPELVAAVEFRHWTADGRLRAPSFKGLRSDIAAEDVVRDT
jgi:bifunctional non-homologous end joining protein LigD